MGGEGIMVCNISRCGGRIWYQTGTHTFHRNVGPALIHNSSSVSWWNNGQLHRLDGPAYVNSYGDKEWWYHGRLHRTYGPAIESRTGTKIWYHYGKCHREDGPAVIHANGREEYWIDDIEYDKLTWEKMVDL